MNVDPANIELTPAQQAEIAHLAAQTGQPWDVVLHAALSSYRAEQKRVGPANEEQSFAAAAQRLGLIGCLPGGPADLSSNPAYLEGFGK